MGKAEEIKSRRYYTPKQKIQGTEMPQELKALAEDQTSVHSTHSSWLTTTWNSMGSRAVMGPSTIFWPPSASAHVYICIHTEIPTIHVSKNTLAIKNEKPPGVGGARL